jgi:hypothetical protein
MVPDEDNYVFDAGGNRVLVGLTLEETREFESLDSLLASLGHVQSSSISRSSNGIRWLVLYEKHEAALEAFRSGSKTKL